jgi:hypothetical protein
MIAIIAPHTTLAEHQNLKTRTFQFPDDCRCADESQQHGLADAYSWLRSYTGYQDVARKILAHDYAGQLIDTSEAIQGGVVCKYVGIRGVEGDMRRGAPEKRRKWPQRPS